MIPPHDHERDDDLMPDPYIEVSWSGRIKKKRRKKAKGPASSPNWVSATDNFIGQNTGGQQQQTQRPAAQRPAAQQHRSQPLARKARFPTAIIFILIVFFIMRALSSIIDGFGSRSSPLPPPTSPTVPEQTSGLVTLLPGEFADVAEFETTVRDISTDVGKYYKIGDSVDPEARYLVFEINATNLMDYERYFFYEIGWSEGESTDWPHTIAACHLTPSDPMSGKELVLRETFDKGETLDTRLCVELPESFEPENPGYILMEARNAQFRWMIPSDVFN